MLSCTTFTRTIFSLILSAGVFVSVRPANAQSGSVATVLQLQGAVSVIKDSSNYANALYLGNQVRMGQVIKTGPDGFAKFQVEDGSTFEVYPNSEVKFRATMGIGDLLNVWIGKVKVWIQHAPG